MKNKYFVQFVCIVIAGRESQNNTFINLSIKHMVILVHIHSSCQKYTTQYNSHQLKLLKLSKTLN